MSTTPARERRTRRRDRRRARRKISVNRPAHLFLQFAARTVLTGLFHVRTENLDELNRARGSLLILGNHSAVIDPFLVGSLVRRPIHYVISDSQLRSRVISFILGLIGVIPKTKVISDLDTVKKIVQVKHAGGVIGVFPEGQSSWDGHCLPLVRATDKLVKSLKVPVWVSRIHGAYFSWPRWARRFRRGSIRVEFRRILTPRDLSRMTVAEVGERIEEALAVNAFEEQRLAQIRYRGARLAEYLERALFACPSCRSIDTLVSHRRRLGCSSCGYQVHYNAFGFFEARRGPLAFETVREWNVWQVAFFREYLDRARAAEATGGGADRTLLREQAVTVQEGFKSEPLTPIGTGPMTMWLDRIEVETDEGHILTFPMDRIEGINVQNNERLEFYVDGALYEVRTVSPRGNTYKWNLAVRHLQEATGRATRDGLA